MCSVKRIYFKQFEVTAIPSPLKISGTMQNKVLSLSEEVEQLKCLMRYNIQWHEISLLGDAKLKVGEMELDKP